MQQRSAHCVQLGHDIEQPDNPDEATLERIKKPAVGRFYVI